MFCPSCRDEFREGFTHCGRCDVDLVEELAPAVDPVDEARANAAKMATVVPMVDYCGFFDLSEARSARERVRAVGIQCEIVIREHPGAPLHEPAVEEYWLRVAHASYRQADAVLQQELPPETGANEDCPACGAAVAEGESFCGGCGIRFDGA